MLPPPNHSTHVEIRRQLAGLGFLLIPEWVLIGCRSSGLVAGVCSLSLPADPSATLF